MYMVEVVQIYFVVFFLLVLNSIEKYMFEVGYHQQKNIRIEMCLIRNSFWAKNDMDKLRLRVFGNYF